MGKRRDAVEDAVSAPPAANEGANDFPRPLEAIRGNPPKRYKTAGGVMLATHERDGRQTILSRTARNNYFLAYYTEHEGERDDIQPAEIPQALAAYQEFPNKLVPFAAAFPGITLEDA